jgi:hypothetical protein
MGKLSRLEESWQRRATAEAIKAARGLIGPERAIPANTPVGMLTDDDFGWLICAVIFAWISTRAEQVANEGLNRIEAAVLTAPVKDGLDAWDVGAIAAILPMLFEQAPVDWAKALKDWSKDEMIRFLSRAAALVNTATGAKERAR